MAATDSFAASRRFPPESSDARNASERTVAHRAAWLLQAQKVRTLALHLLFEDSLGSTGWFDFGSALLCTVDATSANRLTMQYLAESEKLFELTRKLTQADVSGVQKAKS